MQAMKPILLMGHAYSALATLARSVDQELGEKPHGPHCMRERARRGCAWRRPHGVETRWKTRRARDIRESGHSRPAHRSGHNLRATVCPAAGTGSEAASTTPLPDLVRGSAQTHRCESHRLRFDARSPSSRPHSYSSSPHPRGASAQTGRSGRVLDPRPARLRRGGQPAASSGWCASAELADARCVRQRAIRRATLTATAEGSGGTVRVTGPRRS